MFFVAMALTAATSRADDNILTGTPISSGAQTASPAEKAFDGDATTFFKGRNSNMAWVGLDLGQPHIITRIGVTPRDGITSTQRMLLAVMEGANEPDFSDAIPLYLISEEMTRGTTAYFDIEVTRGVRYVRFVGTAGSYCELAEMEIYGHEGEGDDSHLYQVTNLPTVSIHVKNNAVPTNKGEDFESSVTIVYENGTLIQQYPILTRVRGNFSASHENRPYRIKFNDGKSHHMLRGSERDESPAKAKKWLLVNNYGDKTLIRNNIAFEISRRARMPYTPYCRNVDVLLNGEYRGCYQLTDWLGIDDDRIDLTEMTAEDTEGEALTGGYIIEMNGYANSDPIHFTSNHGNPITVHSPSEDDIQQVQFDYIKNHFNEMERRVFADDYDDDEAGYRPLLDLDTFLRYFLACEYAGNTDMIWQVFMYKQRGDDHIYTGPVWDNDLALDNDGGVYPGNERAEWTYPIRCAGNWGTFVSRILSDGRAMAQLQEIWTELRDAKAFEPHDMTYYVDSLRAEVRASQRLNFIRWPYLTQKIHCNPRAWGDWETEVDVVRDYVGGRVQWMDKKLRYNVLEDKYGVYQLSSPTDLVTFSKLVNSGKLLGKLRAVITTNMDMEGYADRFQPIGTEAHPFKGTIDGRHHVISNLHLTGDGNVAFLGFTNGDVTISNLHIDSTCSFDGTRYVGSFVGCMADGTLTLSACSNEGTVTAKAAHAGGLVGGSMAGEVIIEHSLNCGSVQAGSQGAAMIGYAEKATISHSFNTGSIDGSRSDKEFASARSLSLTNCYDTYSAQVTTIAQDKVTSGALCCMLNANENSNVWRQNIDNGQKHDAHPVPISTHGTVFDAGDHYTNRNPNVPSYRYYKLEITDIQGNDMLQFAEFDLLDETLEPYENMKIYKGTTSTVSHEDWPNVADNNVGTKYCSAFDGSASFLFDVGQSVNIGGYRIYTANDTQNYSDRNPVSWNLYAADSRLTNMNDSRWMLIDSRTDDHTLEATNYTPYDFIIYEIAGGIEPVALPFQATDAHAIYDMQGRKVDAEAPLSPGFYIRNGKKFLVR